MKKKIILATGLITLSLIAKGQTWNGTTTPTWTQGANVTIGISPQDNTSGLRLNTNQNNTSTAIKGIFNTGIFNTTNSTYGLFNYTYNSSSGNAYGVYSLMNTNGTGAKYAIYGSSPTTIANSWAGYFDGNSYFSGKVGIGTSTPAFKLDVSGADAVGTIANFSNNGTYRTVFLNKSSGPGNYNNLTQTNDNGIFWSDATISGTNGFVIAPWANSSAGIRIQGNGNVGIGVALPVSNLHISNNNYAAIYMGNNNSTGHHITHESSDNSFNIWSGAVGNGTMKLRIDGSATGNISFLNSNVGIGTSTPIAALHVIGNTVITSAAGWPPSGSYAPFIKSNTNVNGLSDATKPEYTWFNNDQCGMFHPAGDVIGFTTGGTERVRIDANGNIGIGTTSPTAKLDLSANSTTLANSISVKDLNNNQVNFLVKTTGFVYAREINVQLSNFPDYVFEKSYNLLPINELEKYIKTYQHLPNVPSAEEIEKNGGNLGELNKIQMEKIEELTLYIIEMKKEIEELKTKINN